MKSLAATRTVGVRQDDVWALSPQLQSDLLQVAAARGLLNQVTHLGDAHAGPYWQNTYTGNEAATAQNSDENTNFCRHFSFKTKALAFVGPYVHPAARFRVRFRFRFRLRFRVRIRFRFRIRIRVVPLWIQ